MQQTLTDFRIESDSLVCLTFANGSSYRVAPKDLARWLSRNDLRRVRRALRLRQQFMQRILPPTLLLVLVAAIIGVGRYDAYQATRSWLAPSVPPVSVPAKLETTVPTNSSADPPVTNAATSVTVIPKTPAASTQPKKVQPAGHDVHRSVVPASTTTHALDQQQPVTLPTKLAPITQPLKKLVQKL